MRTVIPNEVKEQIRQLRADGVPVNEVHKQYSQYITGTIDNIYYGWDKKAWRTYQRKKVKKKPEYVPMKEIKTYVDYGWRFFVDDSRKAGAVTSKTYTPEELQAKFGQVLQAAEFKQAEYKREKLTPVTHFKRAV